ncbi:MAG: Arc family DNA-binding protein [Candidatus Eremiobacteraeota bacterium]|nr:Arc family DNA-binding protein [Candidatus Eremiobacteraeota bacterium]
MGDLLIRGVSKRTVDGLKARARRHGRSMQAEIVDILERSSAPAGDSLAAWLAKARAPGLHAASGIAAIRRARDER